MKKKVIINIYILILDKTFFNSEQFLIINKIIKNSILK